MVEKISLINKLISESFGENFRADLKIEKYDCFYAPFPITKYIYGGENAGYVWKSEKSLWAITGFPFFKIKIRGKFTKEDGSELLVSKKCLPNAEEYSKLYREAGFGCVEIKVSNNLSKNIIVTNIANGHLYV